MELVYSGHWLRKKKYRPEITEDLIEYAIENSEEMMDKNWPELSNAICRVPPSGRILKVVFRRLDENKIKIITAFWLD